MVPLLSSVAERVKERRRAVQEMERVDHHTANLDAAARGMTASAVIPLTKLMISDMESASEYPAATQAIANKLRVGLQKYEEVEYLNIASALDPRFKVCSQFV
ncbi:hypothetical protein Q1695_000734 [Nippostrongylus brasiliensis]|nr:hypothetical protein Q1695_000734 [Nippostrongylus brasiliensis]